MSELRKLFYVKIPERLFYGMLRELNKGQQVEIIIDENSEYEKLKLETKLEEQMNAHSAYRNKGYKVKFVRQVSSEENTLLQLIDVFMGMVVFLLEGRYQELETKDKSVTSLVKSDLIYRFLIHNNNLDCFHKKLTLFKWEGEKDHISRLNISEYTSRFLIYKTRFDIQEMNRLSKIMLEHPNEDTRFYREKMGYVIRQLRTIQGYLSELNGEGRNSHYRNNFE